MNEENEDIVIEPEHDGEAKETRPEDKIAKIREDLKTCRKEKQEYMDGWQRAKADYVNALKRFETEVDTAELRGKVKSVETLLPAYDSLERAKEHGEIPEGFLAIAKQLESSFTSLGLVSLGVVGEAFDPVYHEAFGQDAVESEEEDDTITTVLEKGWGIGNMVIRPAKVRVGHYSAGS